MTDLEVAIISAVAPEKAWELIKKNSPLSATLVDRMLMQGAQPEWICMRGEFVDWPAEIQTFFLNALHWRQAYLRNGGK